MRNLLLLSFILCCSFALTAQFPNLVATDTDGNEHNILEDYLNEGKPVMIHFFGAWNPWDQLFVDTNSMQTVYDVFGPDGTDQVMLLAYECDSSTTDQMLMGGNPNFPYDFLGNYNFPVINEVNPQYGIDMNLFAYPSVIMFCPDGSIYVDNTTAGGPSNYPSTIVESMFYGEMLEPNGITNNFELNCGISLLDETISGHVTFETDNCEQNFDYVIPGAIVSMDDGTDVTIRSSNANGYYEALLPDGTYDMSFETASSLYTICEQPDPIVISGNIVTGADAIFLVDELCPEIVLTLEPWLLRACDLTSFMTTSVCNVGTVDASIFTLNLNFPPGSELITVNTTDPYTYDMNTGFFTMACDSLDVFTCKDLNFSFHTPCDTEVGDSLCFGMETQSIQISPGCDQYIQTELEDCNSVIGSYDPNDKRGLTESQGEENYLEAGTELEYMIRFQNTGNDTAFTVRIEDQLSDLYIKESIRPVSASHSYFMEMKDGIVNFTFPNILLVDSFQNEPASHGYIKFKIDLRDDLAPGTEIPNTGAIFFDSNDPIITNTFVYTINLPVNNDETAFDFFSISPNPAQNVIKITADEIDYKEVRMLDIQGRVVMKKPAQNGLIDVSQVANGTYFIQLINEDNTAIGTVQKIVVLH